MIGPQWYTSGVESDMRIDVTWRDLFRCAWDKLRGRRAVLGTRVCLQVRASAPTEVLVDKWQLMRGHE